MAPSRDPRIPDLPTRRRRRIADDVQQEISGWIEERAAELRAAGADPAEAARRAREEFGDVAATQQYCEAMDVEAQRTAIWRRWTREALHDVALATRTMARSPALSFVLLLTIALGVGATTAIFSVVHAVLLRALPYRNESALVQLHAVDHGEMGPMGQLSSAAYLALRSHTRSFDGLAAVAGGGGTLTGDGEPENVVGGRASAALFDVLGVRAAHGRTFMVGDDSAGAEPIVLLAHSLWTRRYGGDPAIVGRTIEVSAVRRRVVGVMPPAFVFPFNGASELWTPLDLSPILANAERSHKFRLLQLVGRLRDGTAASAAQADVDRAMALLQADRPDAHTGITARLVPLRDVTTGAVRPALLVLMGASVLLLLIACSNIASVLLARTVARQPELAMRAALGAGRGRIARQLLAESLSLSLAGGMAGVLLAVVGVRLLRVVGASALPAGLTITLDQPVLWVALGTSVVCGVIFGFLPALVGGNAGLASLAGSGQRGSEGRPRLRLRRALVTAQVALSVTLLFCAGLLARSLGNLAALDLGYRTTQLLSFRVGLPSQRYDSGEKQDVFFARLFEELRAIPGVRGVGLASNIPLGGSSGASLVIEGRPHDGDRPPEVRYASASDDYFAVMGIPVRRGRSFAAGDENPELRAAVVSEAAARRFWGDGNPVGARIRLGPNPEEPWHTVVGVVGDVILGPAGIPVPTAYTSIRYDRWGGGSVVVSHAGDAAVLRLAVRAAVNRIDPLLAVIGMRTMQEMRSAALADRRLPSQLIGAFALLAVTLAAVGLYGVGANLVATRRRELGIRLALGATPHAVRALVLGDGIRMVAIGVAVGLPLALVFSRQLRSLLFGVSAFDPAIVLGVVILTGLVGVASSAIPARRATAVDPVASLRE
jgi:predicted permease